MPIRDDSAGSYGTWSNDDLSWLDWLGAKASDGGNALSNLGRNLVDGFSPVGTSEQGNMALQVPPVLSGIAQSYGRLAGTPSHPGSAYDLSGVPELDAPIQQDMSNVLLSLYGGNAVAGLAKGGAARAAVEGPPAGPFHPNPIPLYHGTNANFDRFNTRDMWATPSQKTADGYAKYAAEKHGGDANVMALELHSDKIMRPARRWGDENIARQEALDGGYDAINWGKFDTGGGEYYQVVRPGTVRNANTGEVVFSDTGKPSIFGSALATGGDQELPPWLSF